VFIVVSVYFVIDSVPKLLYTPVDAPYDEPGLFSLFPLLTVESVGLRRGGNVFSSIPNELFAILDGLLGLRYSFSTNMNALLQSYSQHIQTT
jgi:hypothetical protein